MFGSDDSGQKRGETLKTDSENLESSMISSYRKAHLMRYHRIQAAERLAQQIGIICRSLPIQSCMNKLTQRLPSRRDTLAALDPHSQSLELYSHFEHD